MTPTPTNVSEGVSDGTILALAEKARNAIARQPVGYLVDPGPGSAFDRVQRREPDGAQYARIAKNGGHVEVLYTGTSVEQMILHIVRALATLSPPLPSLEVERLPHDGDAAYWRGRYEGFMAALRQTHTPEQLAEMGFV